MKRFVCLEDNEKHIFWIADDASPKMHEDWDDGLSCPWCDAWSLSLPEQTRENNYDPRLHR